MRAILILVAFSGFLILSGMTGPASSVEGCATFFDPEPPPYYQIDLVTTRRVPGSGQARGTVDVTYSPSPFGVSITEDGSYQYNLDIRIDRLQPAKKGAYIAWITTPQIDQIIRLGPLEDASHALRGTVSWNKFLVVISLEESKETESEKWKGPIVLRGLSRSGMMHTQAGHGPFESEPCALYGY